MNRGSEEKDPCQENRSIGMLILIIMTFFPPCQKDDIFISLRFFLLNMNEYVKLYNISAPVIIERIHTFPFEDLASNSVS